MLLKSLLRYPTYRTHSTMKAYCIIFITTTIVIISASAPDHYFHYFGLRFTCFKIWTFLAQGDNIIANHYLLIILFSKPLFFECTKPKLWASNELSSLGTSSFGTVPSFSSTSPYISEVESRAHVFLEERSNDPHTLWISSKWDLFLLCQSANSWCVINSFVT